MEITIQVTLEVARVLQNQSEPTVSSKEFNSFLEELGISLKPIHPGVDDTELVKFFTAEVPDRPTAEQVRDRLLKSEFVEAAYIKEPAEPAESP